MLIRIFISLFIIFIDQHLLLKLRNFLLKKISKAHKNKELKLLIKDNEIIGWFSPTFIIGLIELLLVVSLFFVFVKYSIESLMIEILKFCGFWVTLKILGDYIYWQKKYGKELYYIFLICTILNLFCGVIIGLIMTSKLLTNICI